VSGFEFFPGLKLKRRTVKLRRLTLNMPPNLNEEGTVSLLMIGCVQFTPAE
jgi:hypothetical protein